MVSRLSISTCGWSLLLKGTSWRGGVEDLCKILERCKDTRNCEWSLLLKGTSWRQCVEDLCRIVERRNDTRNYDGKFSSPLCLASGYQCQAARVVFPDPGSATRGCRVVPPVTPLLPHPVRTFQQAQAPGPGSKTRGFHTRAKCSSPLTSSATRPTKVARHVGTRPRPPKRLPLSQSREIEEVLEGHQEVIQQFAAVLGCSAAAMRDMVRRDTRLLTHFDKAAVMTKMRLLLQFGFSTEEILSRYQVFSRSVHCLQSRLKAMQQVRQYRHNLATVLLSDSRFKARMALHRKEAGVLGRHSSQASFLSELLECSQEEVKTLAGEEHHEFLLTLPPSRLQEVVHLLVSFGLTPANIRTKCLMLRCPPQVARARLQRVQDAGVFNKELVAYILTNSDAHFEASFATWMSNAQALGTHANQTELLMHRLRCSEDEVRSLMRRNVRVASMTSGKIQRCLDILQKELELSSETILQQGCLLYYSPRRLRARWALLKPLGLSESDLVRELRRSERKFTAKYGCSGE